MGRNLRWSLIPAAEDFRRSQILSTRPVKPFSPIDPRCSGERVSELFGHAQSTTGDRGSPSGCGARVEESPFGVGGQFRQVMKNARSLRQSFRESRPVGHRCCQLLHAIVARRVRDHVGDPKPRKVSIFHVTPFGSRWWSGARAPGRHKFLFVHVANDVHGAEQPSIQLSPHVQE